MEKIVVCIMGQDCEKFLPICLNSVKDADSIVYCDGGSKDNSLEIAKEYLANIIHNNYNQEDKTMNGKQRNFYLKYLKENYSGYWSLCLDADEVVEDLSKIKKMIQVVKKGLYSVKMRHLIGDLAHEDATVPEHYVLNRLFYIDSADKYPEVEHPVLQPKEGCECFHVRPTTIWHMAYCPNMWDIKRRYDNHLKKSNMHTPEFLKNWYYAHLFGQYPKRQFNPIELPKYILDEFGIDKDEFYFQNRGLEVKHFLMTKQWIDFLKTKEVIEFGCGRAPFGFAFNSYGINYLGIELSKFAVDNSFVPINKGNILDKIETKSELVLAFDVLEHLNYEELDKSIDNLIYCSEKYLLISVPVIGDPNLEADKTHIIHEEKEWWVDQFANKGLKKIPTPDHFLFKDQIMIFEKQNI